MAVFNFYDGKHRTNVPCASFQSIGLGKHIFQRIDNFQHIFSNEVYFKKTEHKNEAVTFVYDKWYKAIEIEFNDNYIEIKNWIEKDPSKEESQNSMQNVIQLIGNNNNFSGNTLNLGDIKLEIFLKGLESSLEANPSIPEEDKKTLLSKLKDFANTPYLSGLMVNSIFNYIQPLLPELCSR